MHALSNSGSRRMPRQACPRLPSRGRVPTTAHRAEIVSMAGGECGAGHCRAVREECRGKEEHCNTDVGRAACPDGSLHEQLP